MKRTTTKKDDKPPCAHGVTLSVKTARKYLGLPELPQGDPALKKEETGS